MRRSGKTTRMVDEMVQSFFSGKQIIIPFKSNYLIHGLSLDKYKVFIDEDVFYDEHYYKIQEHLKSVFVSRIIMEHGRVIKEVNGQENCFTFYFRP